MPSNNSQNIINTIQGQIDQISIYGQDQSGVEAPGVITKTQIFQNSSGAWTQSDTNVENPYRSSTTIRSGISNERNATISNYEGLAIPYDNQLASITQQINQKKSQIVSLVSSAVGAACSVGIASTASVDPIVVGGTIIGFGKTVYQDNATVNIYDYESDYTSNRPYRVSNADLSTVGSATTVFITRSTSFGNLSAGSTAITGINTGNINVGDRIKEIGNLISYGSSVSSLGISTVFMTTTSIGTTSLQAIEFGYLTTTLSTYSGKGYITVLSENVGSAVGLYATVTGISTLGISVPACVAFAASITSIASEILTLRSQRNDLLSPVNQVKDLKKGTELQKWSAERSLYVIQGTPDTLNQTITTLNNF